MPLAIVVVLLATLLLGARPSVAADATRRGEEMAIEAVELARSGRYAEAIELFERAYVLTDNPTILLNVGLAATAQGDLPKAREALERFVQEGKDPANLERGRAALADVQARSSAASSAANAAANAAANDLSGTTPIPAEKHAGLSTLSWVLIGSGAAAVVAGGIVAGVLLANRGGGAPREDGVLRVVR